MSESKLREIYRAAEANAEGAGNYMYPEVTVEGLELKFDVDMDIDRDMDDPDRLQRAVSISYRPAAGGMDDLVYTQRIEGSTGVNDAEIVTEDEFVNRVTEMAQEWRHTLYGE